MFFFKSFISQTFSISHSSFIFATFGLPLHLHCFKQSQKKTKNVISHEKLKYLEEIFPHTLLNSKKRSIEGYLNGTKVQPEQKHGLVPAVALLWFYLPCEQVFRSMMLCILDKYLPLEPVALFFC